MTGKAPSTPAQKLAKKLLKWLDTHADKWTGTEFVEYATKLLDRHFPSRGPRMVKCTRHGDNCSGYECSGLMELTRVHEDAARKIRDTFSLKPTSQDIAEFLATVYDPLLASREPQGAPDAEWLKESERRANNLLRLLNKNLFANAVSMDRIPEGVGLVCDYLDEARREALASHDRELREMRELIAELASNLQHSYNPKSRCGMSNTNCIACIQAARAERVRKQKEG
jgi:hypothetical protein